MSGVETVAVKWHAGTDHAFDGVKFGGPLCNCLKVAERMMPFLVEAWDRGHHAGVVNATDVSDEGFIDNPYGADL